MGRGILGQLAVKVARAADAPAVYVRLAAGGPFPTVQFDWKADQA
jgi:hypothetical protein